MLADDQPTNGTAFRKKILEGVGGTAIQAEDFKALSAEERRELFKDNRVLYVYHNLIDATGDKPGTERQVFEAAEDTLRELVDLVKKAGQRQRHQHLRHRRPRLPVPGRGAAPSSSSCPSSRRATTSWSPTGATSSATA